MVAPQAVVATATPQRRAWKWTTLVATTRLSRKARTRTMILSAIRILHRNSPSSKCSSSTAKEWRISSMDWVSTRYNTTTTTTLAGSPRPPEPTVAIQASRPRRTMRISPCKRQYRGQKRKDRPTRSLDGRLSLRFLSMLMRMWSGSQTTLSSATDWHAWVSNKIRSSLSVEQRRCRQRLMWATTNLFKVRMDTYKWGRYSKHRIW